MKERTATAPAGRSRHDELRALAGGYAVPEVPGHINVLACGVLALLDDLAAAEARAERAEAALQEAEQGFTEAHDYGCAWPIGTSDEPQEQRGQARDTFIRSMERYRTKIRAAVEDREAQQGREPGSPDGAAVASAPTPPTFPAALAEAGRVPEPAPPEQAAPSEPRETTRTVESPSRKDAAENRRGDAASGSLGAEGAHRCPDGSWSKSRRRRCRLPLGHAGPHVYEVNVAAEGAPPPEGTA